MVQPLGMQADWRELLGHLESLPALLLPHALSFQLLTNFVSVFARSCIVMYTVALPGYTHNEALPKYALWRLVCTAMGIAVEVLVSQLVFPVTARMAYRTTMTGTLRSLADVVSHHAVGHAMLWGGGGDSACQGPCCASGCHPVCCVHYLRWRRPLLLW